MSAVRTIRSNETFEPLTISYHKLPNEVLSKKLKISPTDRYTYIILHQLSFGFRRNRCIITQERLADLVGVGVNTLRKSLRKLESLEFISISGNSYLIRLPRDCKVWKDIQAQSLKPVEVVRETKIDVLPELPPLPELPIIPESSELPALPKCSDFAQPEIEECSEIACSDTQILRIEDPIADQGTIEPLDTKKEVQIEQLKTEQHTHSTSTSKNVCVSLSDLSGTKLSGITQSSLDAANQRYPSLVVLKTVLSILYQFNKTKSEIWNPTSFLFFALNPSKGFSQLSDLEIIDQIHLKVYYARCHLRLDPGSWSKEEIEEVKNFYLWIHENRNKLTLKSLIDSYYSRCQFSKNISFINLFTLPEPSRNFCFSD